MPVNIFWFRRDLRLNDNHGLWEALRSGRKILPVFIFDKEILNLLKEDDRRVPFIHSQVVKLHHQLKEAGSTLIVRSGSPAEIFKRITDEFDIDTVYTNKDYEQYAIQRDIAVADILKQKGIRLLSFVDQLIFEPGEVLKPDGNPYTVFTPFKKKWLELLKQKGLAQYDSGKLIENFQTLNGVQSNRKAYNEKDAETHFTIPSLEELGFRTSGIHYPDCSIDVDKVVNYGSTRDIPSLDSTTRTGICLRFGTLSIRQCVDMAVKHSSTWLNELIWREFFMHILAHFPQVVNNAFRKQYDSIKWVNDEAMFQHWCNGTTGYPIVDAGMRELKATGFMHNRVRMVTASFLVKHLLTDWRWGEAWFAEYLLDFELSSNNGNWQWAAGSGCDAAPYFRIFNPLRQQERFDPEFEYVKKWVPEFGTPDYPAPVIDHDFARQRCIAAYSKALR